MKKALITGASRGIGRAAALMFAKAGYELYLISHKDVKDLDDLPGHHYAGDIGDYGFVEKVTNDIERLDVLINNAGVSYVGLLQDMSPSDWDSIVKTNLTGIFNTCRLIIPKMIPFHSGRIINISSQWGNVGASMEVAYSATKGGVNAFTRALAKELAPSGIRVNAIACGVIDTDMLNFMNAEEKKELVSEIPADRMGRPEDVAELILSLSEGNDYLTGQVIGLDGGWI